MGDSGRSVSAGKRPSEFAAKLLELFPWREMLELTDGVQYGNDRPIPENQNGFIVMGAANAPCAGFPELSVKFEAPAEEQPAS